MHTHVAFLRGINVGGHTVDNERLCELFGACGLAEARGFLASGNVLFRLGDSEPGTPAEAESEAQGAGGERGGGGRTALEARIAAALEAGLGYRVPVFARTADEVIAIAEHAPFGDVPEGGKLHIGFLRLEPPPKLQDEVSALAADTDRVAFHGRELYWHVAGRFLDSALSGPAVGKALGAEWTLRTANTVTRIAAKLPR